MHNEENYKQGENAAFRMGEITANDITDKELISKIYKQLMQLNIKKNKQPNQKLGKSPKQSFLQRGYPDGL